MALKIYGGKGNKNAEKALITAEYVGSKIEVLPFEMGVTNKTPEYVKMNPMGKVPVLITPEGPLFESNAIARYVARSKDQLLGTTLYEKGQVDQWCDFAATEIDVNLARWVYPKWGFMPTSDKVEEHAIANVKRAFGALNSFLATHTFLVGNSITVADVIVVCNLQLGIRTVITKEFASEFPHVERYFWTLVNQPEFKGIMGEMQYGDKMNMVRPAPKAVESKEVTPAPAAKETSKPKEVTPAPAAEVDDEETVAPKKTKNALDLLPPSPMVLDNWKRLYSNTKAKDFAEVAIKGFWEMYDPEGYSLWFSDYKYNEENTVSYVTMNKVGGFLQRMDFIRKYAFAKLCILGEAPFKIRGVWLFRGTEIPQLVKDESLDMDLYEWTKVDVTDEAQKARVNAYFEEPDVIDGDTLLEAKCFK